MVGPEVKAPNAADVDGRQPKRIALVTQGYQTAGGIQTAARWLVTGLRGAGLDVVIFDLASSRVDAHSRRFRSFRSWRRTTLLSADASEPHVIHVGANGVEIEPLRYLGRAELSAELDRFDLVQVVAGGPALAFAATKSKPPTVLQVATTVAWERSSQLAATGPALALWRGVMTKAVSVMERAALRKADAVFVMNCEMHSYVRSVSATRVILAPPGVDTEQFTPRSEGWASAGYLLSVCRLNDARKGLERLIRAYARMRELRPSIPCLVLAGRGQFPAFLSQLIVELEMGRFITVRTDVPQTELPSLYQGASAFLQASYEEGFGISVLEAMASGLPVVSTETAGTRETVVHGQTGWLIGQEADVEREIAERTISLWDGEAQDLSRRSRSRAISHFSNQVTLARILAVYRELFDGRLMRDL